MSDFAFELALLLSLKGSDFIKQLKLIASLRDFRLVKGENGIYTVGGEKCGESSSSGLEEYTKNKSYLMGQLLKWSSFDKGLLPDKAEFGMANASRP